MTRTPILLTVGRLFNLLMGAFLLQGCAKYLAEEKANRDDYYNALAGYPTWSKRSAPASESAGTKTWLLKPLSVYADINENLAEEIAIIGARDEQGLASMVHRHHLIMTSKSEWHVIIPVYSDWSGRDAPVEFCFYGDPTVYWTRFRSIRVEGDPETYPD